MVVRPLIRENLRRVSAILNCKKLVSSPPTLSALPLQSLGAVSISVDDHAQIEDGTVSFGQQHGICLLLVRYVAATTTQDGEPHCPPRRSPARFLQLMLTAFTGTIRLLDDRAVIARNPRGCLPLLLTGQCPAKRAVSEWLRARSVRARLEAG